ncbi:spectrin beta chain, non-erythrocytic 4-like isoform X3 [Anas acuta]|uniref:spectrin beta chain, non-erythrocytic 4-like isoform X3 n=1 Tax=Anas acuta TaxID=28680 RepID=UPI0035C896E4
MSGSTARKVQPFTISTKLSLPKCAAEFAADACPGIALASALDNHRGLRRDLNQRISLYLAQARGSSSGPPGQPRRGEEGGEEERLSRGSLARSIKKITLSNWHGEAGSGDAGGSGEPGGAGGERNHNNNNSRTGKAQFKLAPHKDSPGSKEPAAPRSVGRSVPGAPTLPDPSPLLAQFNREMLQAEGWVRGKLRDLKDGCELQGWEQVAQALQREMKDFDNTLIKLSQMGEQLAGRPSPGGEAVRRQLQALREQWQLLKQTAASQSRALGGLRSLQDFSRKAESLEAWIRSKHPVFQEEKPCLAALLQESPEKIQLTRRILDLKQEEQHFQSLHEELNSLAQKLEKQGKSESRSVSARRKHLNKMWLRLQGTLKEHHEALQLALEVAAFLQQAEALLGAIHAKWRSVCGMGKHGEAEASRDRDVRDIASQVMMLDVTVSQLLSLQPSLAARVTPKHRDVKESWARLQQALRTEKAPAVAVGSGFPGGEAAAASAEPRGDGSSRELMGKEAGDKQKRDPSGSTVPRDVSRRLVEHVRGEESGPGCPAAGGDSRRRRRGPGEVEAERGTRPPEALAQDVGRVPSTEGAGSPQVEAMLRELGELWEDLQRKHQENGAVLREIDKALRLVGELDRAERWLQAVAGSLSEPAAMKSPTELRRDLEGTGQLERQLLLCGSKLQALREEAAGGMPAEREGARKMQRKVEMVEEKLAQVQAALRRRAADLRDSLVLSEFLQNLQEEEERSRQGAREPGSGHRGSQGAFPLLSARAEDGEEASSPLGELQEAVEMLNDAAKERERVMEVAAETESLERLVAAVSPRLEALRRSAEALARDTAQAESGFTTVKSEKDLPGLQGLQSRQQEMEREVSETLQGQLEELERGAARLQELCPARLCPIGREVQDTLRAWAGLRELLRETRGHVQQAGRLRHFFRDYLAMISWTEDTRAQIFSESPSGPGFLETPCEELEKKIEGKLQEFEELAAAGQQLVAEEHYLSATIQERLEELQSMLGWVLVRWRAQRHQRDERRDPESPRRASPAGQEQRAPCAQESILSPARLPPCSFPVPTQGSEPRVPAGAALSPPASPPCSPGSPEQALAWDPSETSTLLLPPRGPSGLGGTVNLILSIGKKGEKKKVQIEETPRTLPAAKPSGCKTFWKRCQGLVGNTWGSLRRKRKPPRQPAAEEVLLEESYGEGAGSSSGTPQPAKRPPAASSRPPAPGSGTPPASHTLPKASTGSLFNSLQRRERARAEQARLLTLQGIMGASSLQPLPEERHGPSNTWPLKCGWRKAAGPPGPQLGELLLYVKNPLVRDIDAECGAAPRHPKPRLAPPGAARRPGPKATCPHLALGSVLSLELPKDVAMLGRLRDAAPPEEEEEEERKGRGVRWWEPPGEDTGGHGPWQPGDVLGVSPKAERGTWLEEVSFNPSSSRHKARGPRAAHGTGEERRSPRHPGSTRQHLPDSRPGRQPHEQDLLPTLLQQDGSPRASCRARHREAAHLEMGASPPGTPHRAGAVPSAAPAQHPPSSAQPVGSPASPAAPTQLSVFEWALGSPQPPSPVRGAQEVCHPAHGQFEEEEEELQAIWDGAGERRAPSHPPGSPPGSDTTGGPLILSSANNVLVAKFTLPSAARILQSPAGGKGHAGSPQGHGAAPCLEGTVAVPPSDSPAAWDRRRQRDEEREGGQAPAGKTEFQMMEGTLERKHVLQAGGRKASCRAWGLFHAVLMRQTLCFYQDRRDSLKSSVVALPLNLAGAVCAPDSEYTKKTNCFRLQLRDGSEYLLRAPSQPLMNEWVSKLQQNSGFPEVDYFQAAAQCVEGASFSPLQGPHQAVTAKSPEIVVLPRSNARLQLPQDAQDGPTDGTSAAEDVCGAASPTAGRREQQRSPRTSPGLWDNGCPDEDDCGLVANKRRSYSFTSATYQKITPLAVPQEPREAGGSYSVTLYIGEQAAAVPRARCRSFVARPGSPRDALGEKPPGAPRPKNKSVFKKFFGKKE